MLTINFLTFLNLYNHSNTLFIFIYCCATFLLCLFYLPFPLYSKDRSLLIMRLIFLSFQSEFLFLQPHLAAIFRSMLPKLYPFFRISQSRLHRLLVEHLQKTDRLCYAGHVSNRGMQLFAEKNCRVSKNLHRYNIQLVSVLTHVSYSGIYSYNETLKLFV